MTKRTQKNKAFQGNYTANKAKQVTENKNLARSLKKPSGKNIFIYGRHACLAALANPNRQIHKIFITSDNLNLLSGFNNLPKPEVTDNRILTSFFPENTIHQGIVIESSPLEQLSIHEIDTLSPLIILDQVTDPHNIGAILRSAAAFDAKAVISGKDNAPDESATLNKSASGATEIVPYIKVTNLVAAIDHLKEKGYWIWGLDSNSDSFLGDIAEKSIPDKLVIILGAEGKGLRRLTRENCDLLIKLPISNNMESLNVSNAAAIMLYELYKHSTKKLT